MTSRLNPPHHVLDRLGQSHPTPAGNVIQFSLRRSLPGKRRSYESVLLADAINLLRDCENIDCQVKVLLRRAEAILARLT